MNLDFIGAFFEKDKYGRAFLARLLQSRPKTTELKHLFQRDKFDCTHTCLEILGLTPPERTSVGMTDSQLNDIPELENVRYLSDIKEPYNPPHLLIVDVGRALAHDSEWHSIVAYKDKVYCPTQGVFYAADYLNHVRIGAGWILRESVRDLSTPLANL